MHSVTHFHSNGTISEVRVYAALNFGILDAGRVPNAVRIHALATKVDVEADLPPPADSLAGDLFVTMVKEKGKLVRLSHRSDREENAIHCGMACGCDKGANVVLGLKKLLPGSTQLPTGGHVLSAF